MADAIDENASQNAHTLATRRFMDNQRPVWSTKRLRSSRARGALFGLSAAALFGVSAPLSKLLLGQMPPQMLAALLYLGAGFGLLLFRGRRQTQGEAPLRKADWPYAAAIAISGGMIAPVLMLHGLRQVSGVAGSLLLNLEAPFTIAIAVLFFREHLARREAIAAAIILLGGATLTLERDAPSEATLVGVLLIAAACACWAIDNNLTQKLTLKDPKALVRIKTLSAGSMNLAIALILGQKLPPATVIADQDPALASFRLASNPQANALIASRVASPSTRLSMTELGEH